MTSPTLMQAILAMDAYNQGYNPGLDHGESQIGNATVRPRESLVSDDEYANWQTAGFYAVAYNYDDQTVISYRGTDNYSLFTDSNGNPSDVVNGWITGAGAWQTDQVRLAAQFFQAVQDSTQNIISLTGHSLGAGLAGIVGSIYGHAVTLFDNMPFELSADNIYYYANLSDAEIAQQAGEAANLGNTFNQALYDSTYDDLVAKRTYARDTFYDGGEAWDQNRFLIDGYAVTGEVLQFIRDLPPTQNSPVTYLDSNGGTRSWIDLHSQSLLVNLQFAQEKGLTDWHRIGGDLWDAAFSEEVGEAAGFKDDVKGHYSASSKLLSALAYSAIDEGNLVFGDTGIRAMFDDADQLGKVLSSPTSNSFLGTASDEIAQIFVQYAGILANYKVSSNNDILNLDPETGIIDVTDDNQLLSIDLSSTLWTDVFENGLNGGPFKPIAGEITPFKKDEFFTQLFTQNGQSDIQKTLSELGLSWNNEGTNEATFDSLATFVWGAGGRHVFDRVNIATKNSGPDKTIGERRYDTDLDKLIGNEVRVDVYAGVEQNDKITGTQYNELIFTGKGTDKITATGGRDFISGGDGNDTVDYSSLDNNNNPILLTVDQAKEFGAQNAPGTTPLVEVVKNFDSVEARDLLHSIEVLTGTDYIDYLIVNDLPEDLKLKIQNLGGTANEPLGDIIYAKDVEGGVEINVNDGNGYLKKKSGPGGIIEFENLLVESSSPDNKANIVLTDDDDIITGHFGAVDIYGGAGNDEIRSYDNEFSSLYGGEGEDLIISTGAGEAYLYGGDGSGADNSKDIFSVSHGDLVMDAGVEDELAWDNLLVRGGVQSWWMEKGWASWQPTTSIFSSSPLSFVSAFGALAPLMKLSMQFDIFTSLMFQFRMTDSGQLVVQTAMDRGGRAVIENYDVDLDTGQGTAGVTVFQQNLIDSGSIGQLKQYVNLAMKAGFGTGFDGQDPLILDLDGDGIELSSLNAGNIYFDLDNDGFAERSAWTKNGDDGFLVRDLNGNGQIDNITELFGTRETPGLTALAALDSNQDGKISADDAAFNELQVWQDFNSDGKTDAGELSTLAQLGISEISLTGTTPSETTIRGNTIREESIFTRDDGTTGTVSDVLLQTLEIETRYLGDATISTEAAGLPALKGFGNLTDLQISMTNDQSLLEAVEDFTLLPASISWDELQLETQEILYKWAGVENVTPTALATGVDAQMLAFLEVYSGTQLVSRDANGNPDVNNANELITTWNEVLESSTIRLGAQGPWASVFSGVSYNISTNDFYLADVDSLSNIYSAAINMLSNDQTIAEQQWADHWGPALSVLSRTLHRSDQNMVRSDFEVQNLVRAIHNTGTSISLIALATGLGLENLQVAEQTGSVLSRTAGSHETQIFVSGEGNDQLIGGNWQDVYIFSANFGNDIIDDQDLTITGDRIRFTDLNADQLTIERVGDDLVISVNGTTDTITVKNQYKTPVGTQASQGQPGFGIEDIQFADGTIYEAGDIAMAIGLGTDGDDTIIGSVREDVLEGLKGNDVLKGGDSGDIYFYTLGDGNDQIHDVRTLTLLTGSDSLFLLGGIEQEDISVGREGKSDDVTLTFSDGGSVTLIDQAHYNGLSLGGFDLDNRIEYFFFTSGATMNWVELQSMLINTYTTENDDTTYGFATPDEFLSSAGNDFISGLDGGDTYHFDLGSGQDTIHDDAQLINIAVTAVVSADWQEEDKLIFGEGITLNDVIFSRNSSDPDVTISFTNSTDSLTIIDQFHAFYGDLFGIIGKQWLDRIETFEFSDGTILTWEDILSLVTQGDDGDNNIYGAYYADTLDGGLGNDFLSGGDDSDVYYFGKGYGQDVIEDNQEIILTASNDKVIFKSGVSYDDLIFTRGSSDDLIISFIDDDATLTLRNQFNKAYTGLGPYWFDRIETFEFEDDPSTTVSWHEFFASFVAQAKTDGNDEIYGFDWEDTLDGGLGDDFLSGGNENDTYIYGLGYGHDVIDEKYQTAVGNGEFDIVQFGDGINLSDLTWTRDGASNDVVAHLTDQDTLTIKEQFNYGGLSDTSYDLIEEYHFADGTIFTAEQLHALLIQGTDGDDVITGYGLNDTLDGGLGNDRLVGRDGSDTYKFDIGYGQDVIYDHEWIVSYSSHDVVEFGPGIIADDLSLSRNGSDLVFSVNGTQDSLTIENIFYGSFGYYQVEEYQFADGNIWTLSDVQLTLLEHSSTDGNNIITGYSTDDIINGLAGDDEITGKSGDDTITGGLGNDTLIGSTGADTYIYTAGDGNDVIIETRSESPTDRVILQNILPEDVRVLRSASDTDDYVLTLSDGSTIVLDEQYWGIYGSGIEEIVFDDGTVWLKSELAGKTITDSQTDGDDLIYGFSSDDIINGGLGNDIIDTKSGEDTIDGGAGDDIIDAGSGNDIITGGLGNDELHGEDGSDTYVFVRGDGQDRIEDNGSGDTDRLIIHGYTPDEVQIALATGGSGTNDLLLTFTGTTDSIIIWNTLEGSGSDQIEEIVFDDGTIWTMTDVNALLVTAITGSEDDETLNGTSVDETLIGGLGNDELHGLDGSDTYVFTRGDGQDKIEDNGYYDSDKLVIHGYTPDEVQVAFATGGSGVNDLLLTFTGTADSIIIWNTLEESGFDEIEQIVFDDGTIWTMADLRERILTESQTDGDDDITGYKFSETLEGGLGNDELHGLDGSDTYVFTRGDGQDKIEDNGYYDTDKLVIHGYTPNEVQVAFATGGSGVNDLLLTFTGTTDSIIIWNTLEESNADEIEQIVFDDGTIWTMADLRERILVESQTDGNDDITGYDFSETLEGGLGNDELHGLDGSDTYVFTRGDGQDRIEDNGYKDTDKLVIHGYTPDEVQVALATGGSGTNDLLLTFTGTNDSVTIWNTLEESNADEIEQIVFDDGTIWTMADVNAFLASANEYGDVISGTSGDDTITGTSAEEAFAGGLGNDTISGSNGTDAYHYASGDGNDLIKELDYHSGTDQLVFSDLNASDVTLSRSWSDAEDILVTDNITGHTIILDEQLYNSQAGIEQIVFADSSILLADDFV